MSRTLRNGRTRHLCGLRGSGLYVGTSTQPRGQSCGQKYRGRQSRHTGTCREVMLCTCPNGSGVEKGEGGGAEIAPRWSKYL